MQELKDAMTGLRQTSGRMSHWLLGWSGAQTTRLTSRAGRGLGWAGCWDLVSGNRSLAFDPVPSGTEFLFDSSCFTLISYPSCYSGHQWSHLDVIFSSPPPAHPLQASRFCLPHSQTSPTNPLPLSSVHPGRRLCSRFSVVASSAAPASTYPWKPTRLLNSNLDQAISQNTLGASPCPRVETQLLTRLCIPEASTFVCIPHGPSRHRDCSAQAYLCWENTSLTLGLSHSLSLGSPSCPTRAFPTHESSPSLNPAPAPTGVDYCVFFMSVVVVSIIDSFILSHPLGLSS